MRTTLRIDDDLLREIKDLARRETTSLTQLVNRLIRRGIEASRSGDSKSRRPFRQKSYPMGPPRVDLTKALAFAAELEDEETLAKLARRK